MDAHVTPRVLQRPDPRLGWIRHSSRYSNRAFHPFSSFTNTSPRILRADVFVMPGIVEVNSYLRSWRGVWPFCAGCLVATLVQHLCPEESLRWAWRVPFLCGIFVAVVGITMRSNNQHSHTPAVQQATATELAERVRGSVRRDKSPGTCDLHAAGTRPI